MKPESFAAIMATGIVSISALQHGYGVISWPMAVLAAAGLPVLMYLAALRWRSLDLQSIDTVVGLFTYVAACTVVAARFAEYGPALRILGAMGLAGWLALIPMLLVQMRRLGPTGLRDRARGTWELASVGTSGLSLIFVAEGNMFWGFIFWGVALCLYGVMTLLIAWRALGEPQVRRNVPPDHWILMGGLAIATLAGERIYGALPPGPIADAVRVLTIATFVVATVQIVPLAITSRRQMLDWPAVFPLGMYSVAAFGLALETGWNALAVVSQVFFWIAFVAWLAVVVVVVGRVVRLTSGHGLRPE
ncbi:tellurite resistance/C4-dicarboxylate transporter family protein [Mycolicibacterium peregrinum]|uniref:C4-dicarboxylate ABC transporter n=1 Tax=Mycolicibacterium peregrinum TaxID=43304 RepID=A0A4Z0HX52_MYCPR|nr:tellurite resistance/C4-dicarboxylate transporter family protein [Mycolicibacterium peregrinum]TGB40307.1 C4-dicarboxylate ABC transporter [Mycolicibacterium peregrinum]TGB45913.1 C4-dicarboxylate ABC transporter [Mycolicibacterium peregrinum]